MSGPIFSASGLVAADFDRVAALLLSAYPGPISAQNGWLLHRTSYAPGAELRGGPDRFEVISENQEILLFERDKERYTAAIKGHWRYRGEYEAMPDGAGTKLHHRVYNVAPGPKWTVAVAHRFFADYQARTDRQLGAVCAAAEHQLRSI